MTRSVILGIGNILLTDDGIGVHVARHLEGLLRSRDDVQVIDAGTLSFTLAPAIEDAERLIVIDAAQLNAPPGTVRTFFGPEFDSFLGKAKLTVHEVGLVDLLDIARLMDALPPQRALVAVQSEIHTWGDKPTKDVEAAMQEIASRVIELLDAWPAQCDPPQHAVMPAVVLS
ncbi:MAG TPA: HyaD/HybD family hydrogenase maturation endopeptidase [Povalibacter sp.]